MKPWLVSISSAEPRESSILQQVIWWRNLSLALEMPSFTALPCKFHSMKQFWLHYYYTLQNYKCVLKNLGFWAENANALRLPGCFRGTSCAKPGYPSSWSWCRQHAAFAFTLESSAAETVFHRRKLQSLPYQPTEISALSHLFQSPNHHFSLQKWVDVHSAFATPTEHLHPPPLTQGMLLQAVTQTTAYFRNISTTMISKHLQFKTQVFLKNLVTCIKQLRNKEVNRTWQREICHCQGNGEPHPEAHC